MNKQRENMPVFETHAVDDALAVLTPHRTHSIRLTQPSLESSPSLQFENDGALQKSRNAWPGNRWPPTSSNLVCWRDLPVCQHRSVLRPLGVSTHAINQCYDASLKVNSSARIRTNAKIHLPQQTSDSIGSRFLIIFSEKSHALINE